MGKRIVVIGASLSGIDTLGRLMGLLPKDFRAPILITQHVAPHSPGLLPVILSKAGPLPVTHPISGERLNPGHVYVAPPDRHMLVERKRIYLSHGPRENMARPCIDALFRSAALAYGPAVIGVVLTGQLDDGTAGLLAIKDHGGTAIVQEPAEATAAAMPQSALRHVKVDYRCRITEMAKLLIELDRDDPKPRKIKIDRLAETENRIAEGIFRVEDWWSLEQMSVASGLNCPICRSALYEVKDPRVLRFRCRSGHGFSALSLLAGQSEARENLLSSIFGTLIEEVSLGKRLLKDKTYTATPNMLQTLRARVADLEHESALVCDWLHTLIGLVPAEPERL